MLPSLGITQLGNKALSFKGPGRETRYGIDRVQSLHGIKGLPDVGQGFCFLGNGIAEYLATEVHGGPEAVVIGIRQKSGRDIAGLHSPERSIESIAYVTGPYLLFKEHGFFMQGHFLETELTQSAIGGHQNGIAWTGCDVFHLIARQPARSLVVIDLPVLVDRKCTIGSTEPGLLANDLYCSDRSHWHFLLKGALLLVDQIKSEKSILCSHNSRIT